MRERYRRTLEAKPWQDCDCPFCRKLGIQILIFRGGNRNKRRGAHNTAKLYRNTCATSRGQSTPLLLFSNSSKASKPKTASLWTNPNKDAIAYGNGPLLVAAGPGTGKTEVLSREL